MTTIHCDFCGEKIELDKPYIHLYCERRYRHTTVEDEDAVLGCNRYVGYDLCIGCAKELENKRRKPNDTH